MVVMTEDDVRDLLRKSCDKLGSVRAWAIENDCSAQYVGDVLNGGRSPGPAILKGLGLEAVTTYRRIKR